MKKLLSVLICLIIVGLVYGCRGTSKGACLDNNYDDEYSSTKCCWLSTFIGLVGECVSIRMSNYKSELTAYKLLYSGDVDLDCSSKYLTLFSYLIFVLLF